MLPTSARVPLPVYEVNIGTMYPMLCSLTPDGGCTIGTSTKRFRYDEPTGFRFVHWQHDSSDRDPHGRRIPPEEKVSSDAASNMWWHLGWQLRDCPLEDSGPQSVGTLAITTLDALRAFLSGQPFCDSNDQIRCTPQVLNAVTLAGATAHSSIIVQPGRGFLSGLETDTLPQKIEAHTRAVVALTRALTTCTIVGLPEMSGPMGPAIVLAVLMHGASFIQTGQHWVSGSGGQVSNKIDTPNDYNHIVSNRTLAQRLPVLAFATARNINGVYTVTRYHLILVQGAQYGSLWERCTHSLPADRRCNLMWGYAADGRKRPTYLYTGDEYGTLYSHLRTGDTFQGPTATQDVWALNQLHFFDGFSHTPAFGSAKQICMGHQRRNLVRITPPVPKARASDPQSKKPRTGIPPDTPVLDPSWTATTGRTWRGSASRKTGSDVNTVNSAVPSQLAAEAEEVGDEVGPSSHRSSATKDTLMTATPEMEAPVTQELGAEVGPFSPNVAQLGNSETPPSSVPTAASATSGTVHQGDYPAQQRTWRMRRAAEIRSRPPTKRAPEVQTAAIEVASSDTEAEQDVPDALPQNQPDVTTYRDEEPPQATTSTQNDAETRATQGLTQIVKDMIEPNARHWANNQAVEVDLELPWHFWSDLPDNFPLVRLLLRTNGLARQWIASVKGILLDLILQGRKDQELRTLTAQRAWDYLLRVTNERAAFVKELFQDVPADHPVMSSVFPWKFLQNPKLLAVPVCSCLSAHTR